MNICFNFYLLTNFFAPDVHPKLLIFHRWKFFYWWASKIYDIISDEWIKNYYTIRKKQKEKKSLIAWEKCVRWGFFFKCILYFCFSKKEKIVNFLHMWQFHLRGKKQKMHLVGNLVEPQQYCQIHIERKIFRIPSMLPYFENWNIYTNTTCNLWIPIILLNLLDEPAERKKNS